MIGSCRGQEDLDRVEFLQKYAKKNLNLEEGKDFLIKVHAPRNEVEELFSHALIGIHTMWNEHFGIGIVEMMSFGVVVIAHNSGGPKVDIIQPGVSGYLAATEDEYASAMEAILSRPDLEDIRKFARQHILKFTEEEFGRNFADGVQPIL